MDNAGIVDGALIVVLIAGALVGAKRGLFKSLMGLLVVVLALVGAVMLANLLTEPITEFIAPKVEDAVVKRFSDELDRPVEKDAAPDGRNGLAELLERWHLPADALDDLLGTLPGALSGAASSVKEKAADAFRSAISASIRTLVSGTVHAALVLVFYLLLLIVLKLLTRVLDRVFGLPVLSAFNRLGGAALGLLEAAALLYAAVYLAARFGVTAVTGHADDTYLLPVFLNHSPVELISSFTRQA